ncbi:MAG TPA: hypothetical protein VHV99_02325 [Paraburkholderia sp.]|jgi:hypothetical protein|nr:hypothetical protein [Paraburkholderia sp.]
MRRIVKRFVNAPAILFRAIRVERKGSPRFAPHAWRLAINRVGSMVSRSYRAHKLDHGSAMGRCIGVYGKTPHADAVNVKRPPAGSRLFDAS